MRFSLTFIAMSNENSLPCVHCRITAVTQFSENQITLWAGLGAILKKTSPILGCRSRVPDSSSSNLRTSPPAIFSPPRIAGATRPMQT